MIELVRRYQMIVRYVIAGGSGAVVGLAISYVATDIFGLWYLASVVLSFTLAFIISFLMQKFWAFRDKRTDGMHGQLLLYLVVLVINMLINTSFIYFLVEHGNQHYLIAQIISGAVIALWSFFLYRYLIFKENTFDESKVTE